MRSTDSEAPRRLDRRATSLDDSSSDRTIDVSGLAPIAQRHNLPASFVLDLGSASTLLECALAYASAGWPVFPCAPGGKTPLTPSGFKDASTNKQFVRLWWDLHPCANIATPTGVLFDVLDIDVRASGSGWPGMQRLARAQLLAGAVGVASTRNGGLHIFFPASGRNCASLRDQRLDLKALGGYVLLPPSVVPADDGVAGPGRYAWNDLDLGRGQAQALDWDACKRLLAPDKPLAWSPSNGLNGPNGSRGRGSLGGLVRVVAQSAEGNRNKTLYWAARRALDHGFCLDEIREAAVTAGLPAFEVDSTLLSATRGHAKAS